MFESAKITTAKRISLNLQSNNKHDRRRALIDLEDFLKTGEFSNEELRDLFTEIQVFVVNCLRDRTELVRESTIKFLRYLIVEKLPINDYYLTYILPVIVERIGSSEIVEESEEVRLKLIEFVQDIIEKYQNTEQLKPFLNDFIDIFKQSVQDKYPQIKEISCLCIIQLASALPRDFHQQAENLLKPLIQSCLKHQRYKVRIVAIRAIGTIVMSSSYKALDEAVLPLAERLFDQIPSVRRTVAQVAANWLLEYRDRYSFWHKILPLLLTGLNDEVEETRLESVKLWEQVGLKYMKENQQDLKEQLDFLPESPDWYPKDWKRPNLGCRWLIQRNIIKLTTAISNELTCWQDDVRLRTAQLLFTLAIHAEDGITQNLQELLLPMYQAIRDDDTRVQIIIFETCTIIGRFVPIEIWSKLILPAIENDGHYGHIGVLSGFLKGTQKDLDQFLEEITNLIADNSICFTRKPKMQSELLRLLRIICEKLTNFVQINERIGYNLFKIAITLLALKVDNVKIDEEILDLYKSLKLSSIQSLWHLYCNRLLIEINKNPKLWTITTPERCIFETILLESGPVFGENLEIIGDILVECLNVDVDAESRLKTFWALSEVFQNKELILKNSENHQFFFVKLINEVFVPSLVWHAGLTAESLRTMAAACLLSTLSPITFDLFKESQDLRVLFDKLLPLLLSLMEDASYKSRHLALENLQILKQHCCIKNIWTVEDLTKVYPEIFKRLDDPIEKVRHCALKILPTIFDNTPNKFYENHYRAHHELIIDTLMVHFDDDDDNVQALVFDILKAIAIINRDELRVKIQKYRPVVRNQNGCDRIVEFLEGLKI